MSNQGSKQALKNAHYGMDDGIMASGLARHFFLGNG